MNAFVFCHKSFWQLLFTGGVDAACYDIGDGKILVTVQHGWRGQDVKEFLLQRPEVTEIEWNQKTFKRGEE